MLLPDPVKHKELAEQIAAKSKPKIIKAINDLQKAEEEVTVQSVSRLSGVSENGVYNYLYLFPPGVKIKAGKATLSKVD